MHLTLQQLQRPGAGIQNHSVKRVQREPAAQRLSGFVTKFDDLQLSDHVQPGSLQMVKDGEVSEIATIQAGEFCGETGMLGHQAADKRAVALEDTVVALIAPDVVRHLFEASPRLARETGHTLEVHRKALQSARTAGRQR
jgi:Cyclic nucleotide-binding domain